MKRILSILLLLCLSVFALAACGGTTEEEYTLAIGVQVTETLTTAKVSETVAAIVTDKDGKIVSCRIDAVDFTASENTDGTPNTTAPISKAELGDDYNMETYGGAIAEWYEQARAFETYVTGKTLTEVKATAVGNDGKPTDAELTAGCTIDVTDFIKAIDKAFASEHKVSFKTASDIKMGVAVKGGITANNETADYKFASDFSAVVTAEDKIVSAVIDSAEVTLTTEKDGDGKISATASSYKGTKLEQGDDYGMVEYAGAVAEWYEQAQAFANTAVGKTAGEVASLATEGVAGCTIDVEGYKVALEAAAKAAR